ncbi:MAG: tRNA uridine-5-carboxymethylaminomethyl(34) synthesis GTPase MnmE [Burkholderiales bacterium]|nr:tRNA uridine-5-carboxymethylaminomethyl(34) synthesis GTPase MnmE [Burkholderiales bacterium]
MGRNDTIAAIATAPGRGGIGVVRVSGPEVPAISEAVLGHLPNARQAALATFRAADGAPIDQGLALYFSAPHSFTGQHVLELHGHGGTAVMGLLLQRCLALGARLAEPGEFTQRAFLAGKLDLAQAESVADLIEASSAEGALSAARSLVGEFSRQIQALVEGLIDVRMHVEACVDFPEEEIDPADTGAISAKITAVHTTLSALLDRAGQGAVLRDGLTVVLIGRPNVGKSSLLNRLAEQDVAIVTPIAGTTRDQVRATILIQGVPIHLVDTAGLRETDDPVEQIGIARTWQAVAQASAVLLLTEAGEMLGAAEAAILAQVPRGLRMAWVYNKIDLHGHMPGMKAAGQEGSFRISALTGEGVDALKDWLLQVAGWRPGGEGVFMARARHLAALRAALARLQVIHQSRLPFELIAEELRLAQTDLSAITGEFSPDDLLGEIFSRFCIGK